MSDRARIGIIGDLHGHWDDWDARYFNASSYALLLFTGDLGSGTRDDGVRIARSLGRLARPALIMPGNNDVRHAPEIAAELGHQRGLTALFRLASAHLPGSEPPAPQARLCGYSLHPIVLGTRRLTLLAARPYAMGGGELSFAELLRPHGVTDMASSTRKLCQLVEQAPCDELLVLAHNGPSGLGDAAEDLWGADFRPGAGDWGDPDLSAALAHARQRGKRVLAVIAGHMHSPTRGGATRAFRRDVAGTLYVNAARVPRIRDDASGTVRHHVALELDARGAHVTEIWVRE